MTSLNLPEYDEHLYTIDSNQSKFPFTIQTSKYKSPTLPLHFDKQLLPKNLCESEILNASRCLLICNINETQKTRMCQFEFSQFEVCRRHRDLRILGTIKNWETQHFSALDKQNKGMYQMGLNRKLSRLEEEFERQPSTIKGIDKAKNLQFEIKELKWRLGYIGLIDNTPK